MATRGTIAIEHSDGTVSQIYSHWDNYLEENGRILQNFYSDPVVVAQLIANGDLSSLKPTIEETEFYAKDWGEENVEPRIYGSFKQYHDELPREEFNYIMRRDGNWYVEFHGEFEGMLSQALAELEVLDD